MEPSLLVGLNLIATVLGFVAIGYHFGTRMGRLEGALNGFTKQLEQLEKERRDCEARERDRWKTFEERLRSVEHAKEG